jgi:hypothetical protein
MHMAAERCVTNCVTTGCSWNDVVDLHGCLLSENEQILAALADMIRQRSVVQVHLGPPICLSLGTLCYPSFCLAMFLWPYLAVRGGAVTVQTAVD